MKKIKNAKYFTCIGGWLVAYTDVLHNSQSKQFGDCTSSNILFSALRKSSNEEEEIPPSLKVLPEVISFLLSVQNSKLMMYFTVTDGCNFESGFEDVAIVQENEIIIGNKFFDKKFKKVFKNGLLQEIKKCYEKTR